MAKKLDGLFDEYDAVLISSPYNMRYFSGFSGGEGFCIICKNSKYLLTDSRYTEMAEKETDGFEIIEPHPKNFFGAISEILQKNYVIKVAFEDDYMTYSLYSQISGALKDIVLCGASNKINSVRMIKGEDELEKLRRAEHIGVLAFEHILKYIKIGVREIEIASEIEYFMRKNGAEGVSFDTIVVSGKKTSLPHGKPSDKMIENGDFVTMDFGCVYGGYCSDMTRTIAVGKVNEKQREIYNTVLKAQLAGLESIHAGVICSDADAAARNVIKAAGFGENFGHSLGHGVGLQIHELPNLSPLCRISLEENMIVTCEPGIYIPDFGGVRIEDMVCVKHDGAKNFSAHCTKELIEL